MVVMQVIASRDGSGQKTPSRLSLEALQQAIEDPLASDLAIACGVISLRLERWSELEGRDEARARFADGLEVAVHLDRSCAVPVAEHAAMHLGPQPPQLIAFSGAEAIVAAARIQVSLLQPVADRLPRAAQVTGQRLRAAVALLDQADRLRSKLGGVRGSGSRHGDLL